MKSKNNNSITSRKPIFLMILACGTLTGVFFFPLWKITLEAPQFPEGLELDIWINKFSGSSKYIIQNINILNHYIGMKYIVPDAIPELKYFPIVVYTMLGLGLIAAIINKTYVYLSWMIALTILSLLGVLDFYMWLYDYGHNLDPDAPITVPGMTYMPPVFGGKQLLNFYATSYPQLGTALLALSIIFSFLAFWSRKKMRKKNE